MKSIVGKRLIALLSAIGLAGTTASSAAQADKSSTAPTDTKQESQVKLEKANQKNYTKKDGSRITTEYTRHKKSQAGAEASSLHQDTDVKGGKSLDAGSKDAAKMSKVSKEKSAAEDDSNRKKHKTTVHTDALTVKQKTGVHPDVRKQGGTQDSNLPQPQPDQKTKPETPK
jgi:hypothetical protein